MLQVEIKTMHFKPDRGKKKPLCVLVVFCSTILRFLFFLPKLCHEIVADESIGSGSRVISFDIASSQNVTFLATFRIFHVLPGEVTWV